MAVITPFLWFDDDLEEAIELYASVFDDVVVHDVSRNPDGSAFIAEVEIAGQRLKLLNGGPAFRFNEAFSLFVECDGQAEVDRCWDALTADGGEESQCGWLKDRFGLSWQIVPRQFGELMAAGDAEQAARVMAAMRTMTRFDVAALQAAFDG
ncbi:MAG: VOC family protein [Acidimicrobiales bacterium]